MKKYFLILTILIFISEVAIASRAFNPDAATSTATVSPTPTPADIGFKESAEKASGKQKIGAVLGVGAAVFCGYKAIQTCKPHSWPMCAFWIAGGLLSVKVAADMNKSKNISNQSVNDISINGNGSGTQNLPDTVDEILTEDPKGKEFRSIIDDLKKKGIVINTRTNSITMPNGKTYKPSDFQSVEAMKNAGMSDQMIADAQKAFAEVQQQAADSVAKTAVNSGDMGTTVSNTGGNSSSSDEVGEGQEPETQNGLGINKDVRQVAGSSKIYNGESIGVSVDSLFDMMKRRYELKEDQGSFVQKAK